jgi:hypothetical protein
VKISEVKPFEEPAQLLLADFRFQGWLAELTGVAAIRLADVLLEKEGGAEQQRAASYVDMTLRRHPRLLRLPSTSLTILQSGATVVSGML